MAKNILLVGVGGQGTILASKILCLGLLGANYDVKMSEIHGMSQRGGSVTSHIRFDEKKIYSPVVELGNADIIVAFEKMEALRYLDYLKQEGKVIVNDCEISGMPITSGACDYPKGIIEELKAHCNVIVVDATTEANKIGNAKITNMILLGTLIEKMKLTDIDWDTIIAQNVKPQFVELNKKALRRGMELAK